jgi:hypothetical protein
MSPTFDELRRAVEVIARHRDFPGKRDLVRDGLDNLDDFHGRGRLTITERDRLRAILLDSAAE